MNRETTGAAARVCALALAAVLLGGCLETGKQEMLPDDAAVRMPGSPDGKYCKLDIVKKEVVECVEASFDPGRATYRYDGDAVQVMPLGGDRYMYELLDWGGGRYVSGAIMVTDRAYARLAAPDNVHEIAARHGVTLDPKGSTLESGTPEQYRAFMREYAARATAIRSNEVVLHESLRDDAEASRRALMYFAHVMPENSPLVSAPDTGNKAAAQRHFEEGKRLWSESCKAAVAALDKAIAADPGLADAYVLRGECRWNEGRRCENGAMEDFERAIAIDPGNSRAYSDRGVCHRKRGNTERALADQTRAIGLEPRYTYAFVRRAYVHSRAGDMARALVDLNRAIALAHEMNDAQRPMAYADRGAVYEALGEPGLAAADYREALELEPGHELATEGLQRVGG